VRGAPREGGAVAVTDQGRNIEAIARYFGAQIPRTREATAARDEWQRFYSGLSDIELNFEQQAYDRARNLRLKYNRANAVTPEEKAAVELQALHGVTTEDIEGDPDRRTSTGEYVPPPSGSARVATIAGLVGLGIGSLVLLKLLR
jgi:hypothetical protein